jgi:photosystem II stability/assembly factor-like uncharacterized protein
MRMYSRHSSGRDRRRRLVLFAVAASAMALLFVPLASAGRRAAPVLGWVPQTPFSTQILYGCAVTGTNDVWAVGNNGIMLHSVDGGTTWTSIDVPGVTGVSDYFHAVSFNPQGQGWAVSQNWAIVSLSSAGTVKQTSPAHVALEDVASVSLNHAWIVGGSGTILVTADGGTTWTQQTTPANTAPLDGVAFADLTHGWAVGFNGTVLATADGGTTWTPQTSPDSGTSISINRVACADTQHAWAVDAEGNIFATANGGTTWNKQYQNNGGLLDVTCTDSKHVWASGVGGSILATMDGGVTWTRQDSRAANSLFGIAFWTPTHGVAVGLQGAVVTTTSGGWGDLIRPVTKAINAVTVKKGAKATMRYEVLDATPNDTEWVTIVVKTAKGKAVATWQVGNKAPNKVLTSKYKVTFKKGSYKWYVYAYDAAENSQSKIGSNKFTVK